MSIDLEPATNLGAALKQREHTIAVAESSTGGLISAALLAVPGASAYFLGSTVIYTLAARESLLGISALELRQQRPLTEEYVGLCADTIRSRMKATWGLAELGATGPAGTPYGHGPGICVLAVSGPVKLTRLLETGHGDREQNMLTFAHAALDLLSEALSQTD